jgi:hypothetical protein
MKRLSWILIGALLGMVVGTLVAYAFNSWYSEHFVRSDDDANLLVTLLLFGFWPVFAILGSVAGARFYTKQNPSRH